MSSFRMVVPAALILAAVTGCGNTARLVHTTPDGGVIAIPSNSNYWPFKHRDSAEKMMAERCPNGYDIVEEKEVVTGQVATTSENVNRQTPLTTNRYNLERTSTSTAHSVTDKTEYRITYRARNVQPTILQTSGTEPMPMVPSRSTLPSRPMPVMP